MGNHLAVDQTPAGLGDSNVSAVSTAPAEGIGAAWSQGYLTAAALVALATLLAKVMLASTPLRDPELILLMGVLAAAAVCRLGPSIFAATLGVAIYDFFFIEPLFTFSASDPRDALSLAVFLIVAVLTSNLRSRLRDQREVAREQAEHAVALRQFADSVLEEKAKTESVIEAIEDGLIVLDPNGVVAHANEVACAILQVERSAVLGRRFVDLASPHPHALRIRAAVADFLASPHRELERIEVALFLRGRDHFFLLRPALFHGRDGVPAGVILAMQDVTYIRDQESQREALMATLSHELRTPLTSLSMAIELIVRGAPLDEHQASCLETAHEDIVRLQDLSQRLLDLSRSRAMTIALERVPVDLGKVLPRLVKIFTPQAREKRVTLEVLPIPERPTVIGDETKLSWALSNLIANALRYSPPEGRVTVALEGRPDLVIVSVRDSGPGIAPEEREKIFERFTQVPEAGETGAAGLGLAIVRDIVQAHGGRVHLDSTPGQGSCFQLELPRG